MSSRHPYLLASVCALGHTVVANLIDNNTHSRCTADSVAEALNAEQKLDPESREAWTPEAVKVAVRTGAFDKPGKREFYDFRGRYGAIRDVDVEAQAADEEKARIYAEAARKRKATLKAKKAAQAAEAAQATPEPAPEPEVTPEAQAPVQTEPTVADQQTA